QPLLAAPRMRERHRRALDLQENAVAAGERGEGPGSREIGDRQPPRERVEPRAGRVDGDLGGGAEAVLPRHHAVIRRTKTADEGLHYRLTRSRYLPSVVSTFTHSPSLTNSGTLTTAPVDSVAGLVAPLAVSPLIPGSLATICNTTCGG